MLTACAAPTHYAGIDLRAGAANAEVQALAQQARSGSKDAQLALGIAYEEGKGVRVDPKRARKLYRMAAKPSGGTIYVYVPATKKGGKGYVTPVNLGPKVEGLAEAQQRLVADKARIVTNSILRFGNLQNEAMSNANANAHYPADGDRNAMLELGSRLEQTDRLDYNADRLNALYTASVTFRTSAEKAKYLNNTTRLSEYHPAVKWIASSLVMRELFLRYNRNNRRKICGPVDYSAYGDPHILPSYEIICGKRVFFVHRSFEIKEFSSGFFNSIEPRYPVLFGDAERLAMLYQIAKNEVLISEMSIEAYCPDQRILHLTNTTSVKCTTSLTKN